MASIVDSRLAQTSPFSRLIHALRRRFLRLSGEWHSAAGTKRGWFYVLGSVNFLALAEGTADRARLLAVLGRLLGAQLAGRAPGPMWPVTVTYRGERLVVYVDRLNDFEVLWEVFIEKQYDDLDLPQAPGTILDLGAHLGAALLALHVRFPGARLAAAEADPHTFRRLERTLAPLPGVRVLQAAVSDRDGTVDFLPSRDAWGSGLTEMTAHFEDISAEPEVSVRAVCFDTLMDELGLERADLLKVDIEGGEWPLVKSLNGDRVGTIIMEWHVDMHGRGPEELGALLPSHSVESEPMPTPGRYPVIARPR